MQEYNRGKVSSYFSPSGGDFDVHSIICKVVLFVNELDIHVSIGLESRSHDFVRKPR